jgi:hypothetical protein
MKISRWDRWHQESDRAQESMRQFTRTCDATNGYAWSAGWLSSAYLRMVMSLPRAQRERELQMLEDETRRLEALQIVGALINRG